MMFSLRRLFIALIIFFLVTGGVFALISTLFYYSSSEREMSQEKSREIQATAQLIFTNDPTDPYYPYTIPPSKINEILRITTAQRGAQFFRLVNEETRTIVASSNANEIGTTAQTLPALHDGSVRISSGDTSNTPTINLAYRHESGDILWLSLAQVYFTGPALLLAIQQSFMFFTLILLITAAVYVVGSNFIIAPLRLVQESLLAFGKGNLTTRLPPGPANEFGRVFNAFNTMADMLQAARKRDQEVSEMKSVFLSTAAHQLRTPLSGLRWALSGLTQGDFGTLTKEQSALLATMLERNDEVIDIVNELLNAASLEDGNLTLALEQVDVAALLTHLSDSLPQQYPGAHAAVSLTLPDTLPTITADKTRLRWAVANLIENALHYTPPEGTITLAASATKKKLTITITDTGIGIPNKLRKRLFQKFSRGENAIRRRTNGNGLGLFIAKNVIENHHGTITYTSKENVGTTFTITLPLAPDA